MLGIMFITWGMEVKPVSSWSFSMKYSRLPNTSMPMATRENRRPRSFQLVLTVWAMDWRPTDLRASLKILMILAIRNTWIDVTEKNSILHGKWELMSHGTWDTYTFKCRDAITSIALTANAYQM